MTLRRRIAGWWERVGYALQGIDEPPRARLEARIRALEVAQVRDPGVADPASRPAARDRSSFDGSHASGPTSN